MNLEELMRRAAVWRAVELSPEETSGSGFAALDRLLPGQGWPRRGLTEICAPEGNLGALRLILPALAARTRQDRWSIWIDPPYLPYAPALAGEGVNLDRVLVVGREDMREHGDDQLWWACEQALRCADCAVTLFWCGCAPFARLRRLQLAATAGATWGVLFRPPAMAAQPSPAPLRLALRTVAGAARAGVEVAVFKPAGGRDGRRCQLWFEPAAGGILA